MERQLWTPQGKISKWLFVVPHFSVKHLTSFFLWTVLKREPTETDPVRFVHGPFDVAFLPGQSGRGTLRPRGGGLSEQLPDLSVNVAKEVHVGSSAVQPFILHQELTEQQLWFVSLPHNLELHRVRPLFKQAINDGSDLL